MTFEEKGQVILEKKIILQTVQKWTKSYIKLIALYVHPKIAIEALDNNRLGLENKFLEKNQAEFLIFDKF